MPNFINQYVSNYKKHGSFHNIYLGTFFKVPFLVHISYLFLIGLALIYDFGLLVFLVGISIVIHEYSHIAVAKKFGLEVESLTLHLIGGMVKVEPIKKPKQEFWVSLAGPVSNFVLAGIAFTLSFFVSHYIIEVFLIINLSLGTFNLFPAFPMDGGRIVRALLSLKIGFKKGTIVSVRISQILCVGMLFVGIFFPKFLMVSFVAPFIFMAARQEIKILQNLDDD